jgi:glutamyl-tRNA reductase
VVPEDPATDGLDALVVASARAGAVRADERAACAAAWRDLPGVLLETCHRVERYAIDDGVTVDSSLSGSEGGVRWLRGADAVRHAVEVAVGLDSVVLAEDQVLSQVRAAVASSRGRSPLDIRLGRLMDVALRSGRRARSWLPAQRPSLADLAVDRAGVRLAGRNVLVVGAGRMGQLAVRAALNRGARVSLASRTAAHAEAAAARLSVRALPFDPAGSLSNMAAVVIALSGPWDVGPETLESLLGSEVVVIDLSAPPSLAPQVRQALGPERYHAIDELAGEGVDARARSGANDALLARLRGLADGAVAEYLSWAARPVARDTVRAVAERSERVRAAELDALWRRVPELPEEQRRQIEHMTERLADRLLQEPLARLRAEPDDLRLDVARELFGL